MECKEKSRPDVSSADVAIGPMPYGALARGAIVLLGLVATQFVLFGPSLLGKKVLQPLDLLAEGRVYLPYGPEKIVPHDQVLADQVYVLGRPYLEFARKEFSQGRVPLWIPDIYGGTPFATTAKFSVFSAIYYFFPSPWAFAWMQLAKSIVAGVGAYWFFTRAMRLGFWPAAIGAWCYPVTGFFILWQGYGLTLVMAWLPWMLLAVDQCIRRPWGWWPVALAAFTALATNSGQLDIALLVLASSGLYALWRLWDCHGRRALGRDGCKSIMALTVGWTLGLCLGAPGILPQIEYCRSGARFAQRGNGQEDRPPVGLEALPQLVLPHMYGSSQIGSARIVEGNLLESSAAGYAGLFATLFLAPLAFCSRRHLSFNLCWLTLGLLSWCWVLKVPGVVSVMRLPGFNMFSYNRLVFLGAFAIIAMAATGLEAILAGPPRRRWWFVLPAAVALGLGIWCLGRSIHLPDSIVREIARWAPARAARWRVPAAQAVQWVQASFRHFYLMGAVPCGLAAAGWLLYFFSGLKRWTVPLLGAIALADLLAYGYDFNPQCDAALYYPRVAALEAIAKAPPGRIVGVDCLPPNLNTSHGLWDIRGYDGVDPKLTIDIIDLARRPRTLSYPYARTIKYIPRVKVSAEGEVTLPPALSMFNVRYVIYRDNAPAGMKAMFRGDDYVVAENKGAMPRVYVPRSVRKLANEKRLLARLRPDSFDPAQNAYVDRAVKLPADCRGSGEVIAETPGQVTIRARMETAGLVVLADRWDKGWEATLDGRRAPILRTNHALRGVLAPAGEHVLIFRYRPASFRIGLALLGVSLAGCMAWIALTRSRAATDSSRFSPAAERR